VPVEKIAVGDEVVARNRATGKLETRAVTALTTPHHDKLLEVRVEGEHDPLRPSTGHPFWVKRGEAQGAWIPAGEMRVGDRLQTIGGQWRMITAINPVAGDQTVYNFTVANDHDYFVGETGFLVHNANCPCGNLGWNPKSIKHVMRHGNDIPGRLIHGVFADDPIATTNQAWEIAIQEGIEPIIGGNGNLNYLVPFPETGLQGGQIGGAAGNPILDTIRIVTEPGCNNVVTAFPE